MPGQEPQGKSLKSSGKVGLCSYCSDQNISLPAIHWHSAASAASAGDLADKMLIWQLFNGTCRINLVFFQLNEMNVLILNFKTSCQCILTLTRRRKVFRGWDSIWPLLSVTLSVGGLWQNNWWQVLVFQAGTYLINDLQTEIPAALASCSNSQVLSRFSTDIFFFFLLLHRNITRSYYSYSFSRLPDTIFQALFPFPTSHNCLYFYYSAIFTLIIFRHIISIKISAENPRYATVKQSFACHLFAAVNS